MTLNIAFRLHQFLTRGDTVWASLEPEAHRHLEIAKKAAKPGEPDKPLFPLVFCRHCGTAYYRVRLTAAADANGRATLLPREDRRETDDDSGHDAYLHLSEEAPWPRAAGPALLARLPEALKEPTAQGVERVRPAARKDVPEPIFVDPAGRIVPEGEGAPAALIHRNFLFCLEPSCGVAYTRSQRSERFKLATLGVDNRSTATTILAVRSLITPVWTAPSAAHRLHTNQRCQPAYAVSSGVSFGCRLTGLFARLSEIFNAVVQAAIGTDAAGRVAFDGNGLRASVELGGERSTAAIDSLKVVAFDLATVRMSMEGRTRLPAFLIHDSPREADLGLGIYRRLFRFVRALEDVGAQPSFQYVVTTTTSPPDELRTEPWLVATLGGAAGERLLRRDL